MKEFYLNEMFGREECPKCLCNSAYWTFYGYKCDNCGHTFK